LKKWNHPIPPPLPRYDGPAAIASRVGLGLACIIIGAGEKLETA
jgi:hypothetical protein